MTNIETAVAGVRTGGRALETFRRAQAKAALTAELEQHFEKTETYEEFRTKVFDVLALREAQLAMGKSELKGVVMIGPAGSGKSRMVEEIMTEHQELVERDGGWKYGSRILSIIVPGRSTVKETMQAILEGLGYSVRSRRDEQYLTNMAMSLLKKTGVAAVHLDEVQDSGRYKTRDSVEAFLKIFRNMMQHKEWPVCLILTATPEAKALINMDSPLLRRVRPQEICPIEFKTDGPQLKNALQTLSRKGGVTDHQILEYDEFIQILIHASARRFGVAVEIGIMAIVNCRIEGGEVLDMGDFADAYEERMCVDDELNPFVAEHWSIIDTEKIMQRFDEERNLLR